MIDEYISSYKKLEIKDKRDILLNDMIELLNKIEELCLKKNVKIEKLKSKYYLKNKNFLLEEDYCDLLFIYITYLKEDLALLL